MMVTIKVRDKQIRIKPFAAREGLRILTRLATLLGPAAIAASGDGRPLEAFTALCDRLKPADLDWLIDAFTECSELQVTEKGWIALSLDGTFDAAFGTDYAAIVRWLREGLTLNYADFFGSIGLVLTVPTEGT